MCIRDRVIQGVEFDELNIPRHPNNESLGVRNIKLISRTIYIEKADLAHSKLRLKEFGDFDIDGNVASFVAKARTDKRKIVHWTSKDSCDDANLSTILDGELVSINGKFETNNLPIGTAVQLERIGYGIISSTDSIIFTHD